MTERPQISSRELGEYLAALRDQMQGNLNLLRQMSADVVPEAEGVIERIGAVAQWLINAKFTIDDPFRYKLVCEYLADPKRRGMDWPLSRFEAMARAALKDESLLEFISHA